MMDIKYIGKYSPSRCPMFRLDDVPNDLKRYVGVYRAKLAIMLDDLIHYHEGSSISCAIIRESDRVQNYWNARLFFDGQQWKYFCDSGLIEKEYFLRIFGNVIQWARDNPLPPFKPKKKARKKRSDAGGTHKPLLYN